jgi:hypothetical protein
MMLLVDFVKAKAKANPKRSVARLCRPLKFALDEKRTICDPQVLISSSLSMISRDPDAGPGFVKAKAKAKRKTQKNKNNLSLVSLRISPQQVSRPPNAPQSVTFRSPSLLQQTELNASCPIVRLSQSRAPQVLR